MKLNLRLFQSQLDQVGLILSIVLKVEKIVAELKIEYLQYGFLVILQGYIFVQEQIHQVISG